MHSVLCAPPWWNGNQEEKLNCCKKIKELAFPAHLCSQPLSPVKSQQHPM